MDPNDWTLTGNSIDPTNFLGTTNNEPLIIKTNGVEHLSITQNGNVGIGTTDPSTNLEVGGQIYINITDVPPGTTSNLLSFLAGTNGFQFHWGHFYLNPSSIDNRLYFGASNSLTTNPPSPIMTW